LSLSLIWTIPAKSAKVRIRELCQLASCYPERQWPSRPEADAAGIVMDLLKRVFVGRHIKLHGLLLAIIDVCLSVFIYGFLKYPDAPYRFCAAGDYCGKTGIGQ
jgi:hypothetical protein